MSRPERSTAAGRAYLDLQRLARTSGRSMQVLLPMFASERWLARLAVSDHRFRFVLKGGVLLAALGNRRPTQDADLLALGYLQRPRHRHQVRQRDSVDRSP
jgi:hypothetical protein